MPQAPIVWADWAGFLQANWGTLGQNGCREELGRRLGREITKSQIQCAVARLRQAGVDIPAGPQMRHKQKAAQVRQREAVRVHVPAGGAERKRSHHAAAPPPPAASPPSRREPSWLATDDRELAAEVCQLLRRFVQQTGHDHAFVAGKAILVIAQEGTR